MTNLDIIFVTCLLSIFSYANAEEKSKQDAIIESMDYCKKKSNVPGSALEKFIQMELEDTPEMKVFVRCMSEKTGMMKSDGTVDFEAVNVAFKDAYGEQSEKATGLMKSCVEKADKEVKKDNLDEYSFYINKCYAEEVKKAKLDYAPGGKQ